MKARRRVRVRSALLLSTLACLVSLLFGAAMGLSGAAMPPLARWLLEGMVTVIAFGMTAYLGLFVLDGDQRKVLRVLTLTRGQIFWLSLLGVLLAAPMTLTSDAIDALLGAPVSSAAVGGGKLFLLTLVKSALLAPACEELFFRGYLQGALLRHGKGRAVVVSALVFALAHGLSVSGFVPRLLLGLLFGWMMERTGTLLAPMLMHGCYNAALVLIAFSGLAPLFTGLTLVSCALRLLLSLACLYALVRALKARGLAKPVEPLSSLRFSRREWALLTLSALMMILSEVLA